MSYEIWTVHRYGKLFGLPENKLADGLTVEQARERVELGFVGHLRHNLLVVNGDETIRANKWLEGHHE